MFPPLFGCPTFQSNCWGKLNGIPWKNTRMAYSLYLGASGICGSQHSSGSNNEFGLCLESVGRMAQF